MVGTTAAAVRETLVAQHPAPSSTATASAVWRSASLRARPRAIAVSAATATAVATVTGAATPPAASSSSQRPPREDGGRERRRGPCGLGGRSTSGRTGPTPRPPPGPHPSTTARRGWRRARRAGRARPRPARTSAASRPGASRRPLRRLPRRGAWSSGDRLPPAAAATSATSIVRTADACRAARAERPPRHSATATSSRTTAADPTMCSTDDERLERLQPRDRAAAVAERKDHARHAHGERRDGRPVRARAQQPAPGSEHRPPGERRDEGDGQRRRQRRSGEAQAHRGRGRRGDGDDAGAHGPGTTGRGGPAGRARDPSREDGLQDRQDRRGDEDADGRPPLVVREEDDPDQTCGTGRDQPGHRCDGQDRPLAGQPRQAGHEPYGGDRRHGEQERAADRDAVRVTEHHHGGEREQEARGERSRSDPVAQPYAPRPTAHTTQATAAYAAGSASGKTPSA